MDVVGMVESDRSHRWSGIVCVDSSDTHSVYVAGLLRPEARPYT